MILRAGSRGTLPGAPNPLLQGLLGFWEFEADGSDSSGNGNDLTAVNTPAYAVGIVGNGAQYTDNDSDYHYLPYTAGVTPEGGSPFTLITWVYVTSGYDPSPTLIYIGNPAQTEFVLRVAVTGTQMFLLTYSSGTTLNGNVVRTTSDDAWHMVAVTFDGTNQTSLSVDAGTFATVTGTLNTSNDLQLRFGNGFNSIQATQQGDQAALYNRVLPQDEIDWFYNSGSGRSRADLLAYTG